MELVYIANYNPNIKQPSLTLNAHRQTHSAHRELSKCASIMSIGCLNIILNTKSFTFKIKSKHEL